MEDVVLWINSQRKPAPRRSAPIGSPRPGGGANSRYVEAALNRELNYVRYAPVGQRNENLYHASKRLSSLTANPDSGLSEQTVRAALYGAAAALASDDGEKSVLRTIESGWKAGANYRREIPGPIHG
jgi:hypothetical protein